METAFFFFFSLPLINRVKQEQAETGRSMKEIVTSFYEDTKKTYDVFISYSYLDDPYHALGTALLLRDVGLSAYLPKRLNPVHRIAPKLAEIELTKVALLKSRSLISLNSVKASRSHWIPWEIGFISGLTGKVAILSIAEDKVSSRKREFVQLYPDVGLSSNRFIVREKGNELELGSWIHSIR